MTATRVMRHFMTTELNGTVLYRFMTTALNGTVPVGSNGTGKLPRSQKPERPVLAPVLAHSYIARPFYFVDMVVIVI